MIKAQELREMYFEFFRTKGHEIVPSAPMVVKNDPTLMFTNAGMNQFKDYFLGNAVPKNRRVANSQKCLRVSGKHNDLEEVGHDTYHHTMFEMLGNWSFGDYFKKEAIEWAWEFLNSRLGIPENRLYATVFEGSAEDKVARDEEAYSYWKKCFPVSPDHIIDGSKKDNFWEMGETGPCGPCSEIHVDLRDESEREKIPGEKLVNKGHPLVIEIWNLVFIQYNRKADGSLELLPSKHVDTGMGFERLCMTIQGKKSNYDTDIFQSLISEISSITGKKYGESENTDVAMRVIADHVRAVAFSIADGQMPSNNKAGYVIRRILRRAVRYGYNYLNAEDPIIYKLVPVLANTMGSHYPELVKSGDQIAKVIQEEESAFLKTLGKGLKMINKMVTGLQGEEKDTLPGSVAFELYDTFGFPIDLTQLIMKENGMRVDMEGFQEEMNNQKSRSREDAAQDAGDWIILREGELTKFTGYEKREDEILIVKYRKVRVKGKEALHLVFNKTPFYAESGGQVGDTGYILSKDEKTAIIDTIKENNLIIHITEQLPSDPKAVFNAGVDLVKRQLTENNHSATHLLHFALRVVLGTHVEQKGSLVTPDHFRFDFSHFAKMTKEEVLRVEEIANQMVRDNLPGNFMYDIPVEKAKSMGAMALFGEKYGDTVRVVQFGKSIELCGGTHTSATGNIGLIKITSESAIAAGIRRIEAVTGLRAEEYINRKISEIEEITVLLKSPGSPLESVGKLVAENSHLRKTIGKLQADSAISSLSTLEENSVEINGIRLVSGEVSGASPDILKTMAFEVRKSSDNSIAVFGSAVDGKVGLIVMVCDKLVSERGMSAVNIIKEISPEINGGGGGQPFLATAGGKKPEGIAKALLKAADYLRKH
jgi:alanyl-tRNA synthetase